MNEPSFPPRNAARRTAAAGALAVLMALAGCGGGGGGGVEPVLANPVVASSSSPLVGTIDVAPQYGRQLVLSLTGTELDDANLSVTATGCTGLQRSTSAPYASSATLAFYVCTASAVGTGRFEVRRMRDAQLLRSHEYTVLDPQVRLIFNGDPTFYVQVTLDVRAPVTVRNFLDYVNARFYDGTVIHRLVPGFVAQGGGHAAPVGSTAPTLKTTRAPIALEIVPGLNHTAGTIAMARGGAPDSATSQWFFNLADNAGLNGAYAVFGRITTGAALLGASGSIAAAPCVPARCAA